MSNSFSTPWTVDHQAPLSMRFPRQEYCSELLFSATGDLPNPGIEPALTALAGGFFTTEPPGKSNPIWLIRRENRNTGAYRVNAMWKIRYRDRIPCDDRGRDWSNAWAGHGCQGFLAASEAKRKAWNRFSSRAFRESVAQLTPWLQISSLQSYERIHFYFKPSSLLVCWPTRKPPHQGSLSLQNLLFLLKAGFAAFCMSKHLS